MSYIRVILIKRKEYSQNIEIRIHVERVEGYDIERESRIGYREQQRCWEGIALELARRGAFVYITGRTTDVSVTEHIKGSIDSVLREIKESGGSGAVIRCDHTKDQETEAVIRQIAEEQGRLDILVNNVWGGNDLAIEQKPFGSCLQLIGTICLMPV